MLLMSTGGCMSDVSAMGVLVACVVATVGLLRLCGGLMPAERTGSKP